MTGTAGQANQASPAARVQGGGWTPPIPGLLGWGLDPNVFAAVTHDVSEWQVVYGATATEAASLTASITAGSPYFEVIQLQSINVTTYFQTIGSGELPAGQSHTAPSKTEQYTVAGNSDGVRPLSVQSGQMVALAVSVDVPEGASLPPGPFTGTAVIHGYRDPVSIDLHCEYLAVGLNSPIGHKWQAMGGEPFFGTVLTNAGPAPDGSGTIQTFANGALYQVPAAPGAQPPVYYLSNAVYAKWLSLQGATDGLGAPVWNALGFPTSDTFATAEGGQACDFHAGAIVVRKSGPAWVVYGNIYGHYTQFGNLADPHNQPWIGLPASDEEPVDPLDLQPPAQRVSHFDGGDIYWSAATGAHELHGAILQEWIQGGWFGSPDMGLPTTDETSTPDNRGRFNRFQGGGAIYWTSGTGAHALLHPIVDRWDKLRGVNSYLGYPTSDQSPWTSPWPASQSGYIASFERGQLFATPAGIVEMPTSVTFPVKGNPGVTAGNLDYSATLTLKSNGDWSFSTWVFDDAALGYDFQFNASLTAPGGIWLGCVHSGNVAGKTSTGGSRTDNYSESGNHKWIAAYWTALASAQLNVTLDYQPNGVVGFLESQAQDMLKFVVADAVGGPVLGFMILLGSEASQAGLGISGTLGVFAGVAVFALTGDPILAIAAGVAAGEGAAANISQRAILQSEYDFADNVFRGTLPHDLNQIQLTNICSSNGTAITLPGPDGTIYVNLGSCFFNPTESTPPVGNFPRPGQVFIHELTHAWQIHNNPDLPYYVCQVAVTKVQKATGTNVYNYGPPTTAWGDFNPEAQASVVDMWFGGVCQEGSSYTPLRQRTDREDVSSPTFGLNSDGSVDPYFHYIQDNIRAGKT